MPEEFPIAALGATSRQVTRSPWGPDDQLGMLNAITPESRARIMAEADFAKVIDLSVDFFVGMPYPDFLGDPGFNIWMSHTPRGQALEQPGHPFNWEELGFSGDCLTMFTHTGTHIDALNHFGYRGEIWNGFNETEHLHGRGWSVCGADTMPPIVARGVLLDIAGLHGVDILPDSYAIGPADIERALREHQLELRHGDVILVRTGRMRKWPDPRSFMDASPGIDLAAARLLARAGSILQGADNLSLEVSPPAEDIGLPVHAYLLAEAGIPIMEIANLEELAAEGVREFAFVAAPIKLRGATGTPLRPIAMPLRQCRPPPPARIDRTRTT
jgi:kynurenine formamidase